MKPETDMANHPNRSRRKDAPGRNPKPAEIAALREEMELTQTEFGRLLHTSMKTVQAWEAGTRRMPALAWEFANLVQAYPSVQRAVKHWRAGVPSGFTF